MHRVFYCFYGEGIEIPSQSPVPIEYEDDYMALFFRLTNEGDFLGFIDHHGQTLQIMYHSDEGRYWIEIPQPEIQRSYGRYMTSDEAIALVNSIPTVFSTDSVAGLEFKPW